MTDFSEQRICMDSILWNEYSKAETLKKLEKAFGVQVLLQKKNYKSSTKTLKKAEKALRMTMTC